MVIRRFLLAFSVLLLPGAIYAIPYDYCIAGCEGSGGSGAGNGTGACTGQATTILATVTAGSCAPEYYNPPADPVGCIEEPCSASITRSWTGVPPHTALKFCLILNGVTMCLTNPPDSGSGTGSDTRQNSLNCGWTDFKFTLTTACGTNASATVSCAKCHR